MIVTHKINMNLDRAGVFPKIDVVQGDANTREIQLALYSGGQPWEIPAEAQVLVRFKKSDGTGGTYDTLLDGTTASVASGNAVTVTLAPQVVTTAGVATLAVTLIQGEQELTTFSVLVNVQKNPTAAVSASGDYVSVAGMIPVAAGASLGQILVVESVDENGNVTSVKPDDVPQGEPGPVGPQGPQGETGPAGPAGENGTATDEQVQTSVKKWLDEHPEATTTVQDGSITEEKLTEDLQKKIKSGGEGGYKWAARGYMREQVRTFQGWANSILFDESLNVAVGYVSSDEASHSSTWPAHRVEIDPNTGYMSNYEEFTINRPEGEDVDSFVSVVILQDGTYLWCDWYGRLYTSSDHGRIFDYVATFHPGGRTTHNNDTLYGMKQLSNGRILAGNCGNTAAETYYSDDNGLTWATVNMDNSKLGQQVYPEGYYVPFEPFFVECGGGKVIQYARASMNAYKTYADGSCTAKEAAVYSISEDYGLTWSAWQWSTTLADMTANNGKAIVIGDKVHAVYGSRFHAEDNYFHLFYVTTNLTDILNDKWETPVVIDVGHWDKETATNPHDCGYPSIFADANHNLFAVYYDGDGTGSAYGANWRLCVGTPGAVQVTPVTNEGGGSMVVGYTQSAVEALLAKQAASFRAELAVLYELIGQLPPDSGENDGSYYITDALVMGFDLTDESKWTDNRLACKSVTGEYYAVTSGSIASLSGNSAVSVVFYDNYIDKFNGLFFKADTLSSGESLSLAEMGIDNSDGFSIEISGYKTWSGASQAFRLDLTAGETTSQVDVRYYALFGIDATNTLWEANATGYSPATTGLAHSVYVLDGDTMKLYVDGALVSSSAIEGDREEMYNIRAWHRSFNALFPNTIRFYNKPLTIDQVKNNYKYFTNKFTVE